MSRTELKRALAGKNPDLSADDIERIVRTFYNAIIARLALGGRVEIRGFGSFETRQREARIGLNPSTGEQVKVRAKRALHFKPGKELRKLVDASGSRGV